MQTRIPALLLLIMATATLNTGCAGSPPGNLGVKNGKLAACPDRPNCVSSQAGDEAQHIAPLNAPASSPSDAVLQSFLEILRNQPGARIVETRPGYVRAEFSSKFFGFVDDAEFWWRTPDKIEVRSASRLGYSDLGVNRARIEALRTQLQEKLGASNID